MLIHPITSGPVDTIGYLVACERSRRAVLIDCPLGIGPMLAEVLEREQVALESVVLTHGHWDHLGDAASICLAQGVPLVAHADDAWIIEDPVAFGFLPLPVAGAVIDRVVREKDRVAVGDLQFEIFHVPGHTPGHIALYEANERVLFAGDVLFSGGIGRTDFPRGDYDTLMRSITVALGELPDDTTVYPGHGPATTLGREREWNPFIRDWLDTVG